MRLFLPVPDILMTWKAPFSIRMQMLSYLASQKEIFSLVPDFLRYTLLGIRSGPSSAIFASSSSCEIVLSTSCSVDCRLAYRLTQEDQNNLFWWSICTKPVSPSTWINLKSPSNHFDFVQRTTTEQSSGSLRSSDECLMSPAFRRASNQMQFPPGQPLCNSSSIKFSISLAGSIWERAGLVRAGFEMTSKTKKAERRPFGPTVLLTANTAGYRHSLSEVWRSVLARMRSYAKRKRPWYLSAK